MNMALWLLIAELRPSKTHRAAPRVTQIKM
jgi:hypothetical protein